MYIAATTPSSQGKTRVPIHDHFDMTEFHIFNTKLPKLGYDVEYMSHLWGNPPLMLGSSPDNGTIEATCLVERKGNDVTPAYYKGFPLICAYSTGRLRYTQKPEKGKINNTLSAELLRHIATYSGVKIRAIYHSL